MAFAISIFSFTLAFYAVHAVKLGTSNLLELDEARLRPVPDLGAARLRECGGTIS